jgi:hypothetical protein
LSDSTNADDPEWEDDSSVDEDYLAANLDLDEEVLCLDNTIPTRVTKSGKRASLNRLKHGPEMPCYNGMSAAERQVSKEVFVKQRKKHLDASRHAMLREVEIHHNESTATIIFTGNLSPTLRTMDQVCRE